VFYVENQGVYVWSTLPEGEDPPVWGRFNEPGEPWTEEGMTLSEFLIQACLFEAVMSAPHGAATGWVNEPTLTRIVTPLPRLPLAPWHWPVYPTYFHAGGGAFVFSCPSGDAEGVDRTYSVWVAAKTPQPLGYLREIVDDTWDSVYV
jgi:hypothetical protein